VIDKHLIPLGSRTTIVADGARNLHQEQGSNVRSNVLGIADRVRRGGQFQPLIATQRDQDRAAEVVLMEGHTRATAYALTDLPDQIDVIIGTSAQMGGWRFF